MLYQCLTSLTDNQVLSMLTTNGLNEVEDAAINNYFGEDIQVAEIEENNQLYYLLTQKQQTP
jgi:hypothetical protein